MEKDCPNCKFELYEADEIPCKDCGMDDREYWQPKPQTNAERIRAMSDEELAEFLEGDYGNMAVGWALEWLKQPADNKCVPDGDCK